MKYNGKELVEMTLVERGEMANEVSRSVWKELMENSVWEYFRNT